MRGRGGEALKSQTGHKQKEKLSFRHKLNRSKQCIAWTLIPLDRVRGTKTTERCDTTKWRPAGNKPGPLTRMFNNQ